MEDSDNWFHGHHFRDMAIEGWCEQWDESSMTLEVVKAITTSLHSRSVLGRVIVESLTKSFN